MSFLDRAGPRWFTIPAHRPFIEDLAAGLYAALAPGGPEALSDALVLTPTRRGARGLAEAFLKIAGGRALLLPQIRPLGDLDEGEPPFEPGDLALGLPPAISPWRRRFELAGLVSGSADRLGRTLDAAGALELADALAGFLDSVQIEEASLDRLEAWVDIDMARHWQVSADLLKLAAEAWPARLEALGLMDLTSRRVALLKALATRWRAEPPGQVLVAAGSTGTAPAAAALLDAIAHAPQGAVVLPGLDQDLADKAWAQVGEQHPQGAMKRLLERAGVARGDVLTWSPPGPGDARGRWRRRIINEALRPPEATADWLDQIAALQREGAGDGVDPVAEGLSGLAVIGARSEEEAAQAAALLLRETLETPERSAALITPDAALARRVSARMARWGIAADSSAGAELAGYPVGTLAAAMARAAVDPADPVLLLALLKHPFARLGREPDALADESRALERFGLRGPRLAEADAVERRLAEVAAQPAQGEETRARLAAAGRLFAALTAIVDLARAPYTGGTATPAETARALAQAMEALAEGPQPGEFGRLWSGAGGEAAAGLIAALIAESEGLPKVTPAQFADLVERLLAGETVRAGGASHPRLRILGAIEARLVRADVVILAGLEEGVWPAAAPIDPFLSRPMRQAAGLPPPERRIGLSAHDFAQAACAPNVVLLHSERRGGAPAVASRWLWRLRTLARGARMDLPSRPEVLEWSRELDAPTGFKPAPRPRPTPPLAARPRTLAVTGVERWIRDPYGLYARSILKLYPLERPDEPIEARARGTAIHAAFERFALDYPDDLPETPHQVFADLLIGQLAAAGMPPARLTRERALAANVAPWVVDFERRRRAGAQLMVEQAGQLAFESPAGPFTVTAKADRIELRGEWADVLDFKTGHPPSRKQVESGLSPQLTLTAAILRRGGFEGVGRTEVNELVYVRVSGGRVPGREELRGAGAESPDLAERALEGLIKRVAAFDDPARPYLSWAAPQFINQYPGDYDHLARLWEWHVIGEGESEGGSE
ncbi:MAG: double-strand break repair protein AddB [Caulobacteraceae bacterium]|nr:double-strand break repair protein AddB [Caulobacteraceae bacterium]